MGTESMKVNDVERDRAPEIVQEDIADGWVTGIVSMDDDPDIPAFTVRMVVIGVVWAVFLGFVDTVLTFRYQPIVIPSTTVILLTYPIGIFLAKVLPKGLLNPGPFSVKELCLVWILASSAGGQPYGLYNVVGQNWKQFMGDQSITYWNSLPWVLSTQMIGYGASGIARRFIVYPKAMLWPTTLPYVTLLNSYFEQDAPSRYHLSRFSFFWISFTFMFIYQWLPSYFAPALSMVSLLCLITNNKTLRWLGSSANNEGVGMFALSFDWTVANGLSAIYTPWWAALNNYGGYILFTWIFMPLMYITNPFNVPGGYESQSIIGFDGADAKVDPFPRINSNGLFSREGRRVKVDTTQLLNGDYSLNSTFYDLIQPIYLSPGFTMGYFSSFLTLGALISHTSLWYGESIVRQTKDAFNQLNSGEEDELNMIMKSYPEIPDYFYIAFLVGFTILSVCSSVFTAFKMPILATLGAIALGILFIIPIGIVQAISGSQIGLNVLTQMCAGFTMPGNTVAVMCFKTLGYDITIQGLNLSSSQKIGHYLHIPPRAMFISQMIGTLIGVFVNTFAVFWAQTALEDVFIERPLEWFPNGYVTFVNAAGIWGAIGPARFFGTGAVYSTLMWGFLIGFILPFLPWALNKLYPHPNWHLINIPLLVFNGNLTGANQSQIFMGLVLCFVFNKIIYERYREWWTKYTFMLGFGFDTGAAITSMLALFTGFILASPGGGPLNPQGSYADYYCIGLYWQNDTGTASIASNK
ncbi:OPT oligopeptide transporter protein-domain-containing protein [Globomyces pollinis-pini]|nr:OPT oligopeptide transporter protein-domain-containing protein [Globomyces pollinis-pini]